MDQHALQITSELRRRLPKKLARHIEQLDIILVGEKVEIGPQGKVIKQKGHIEIRGTAANVQIQQQILETLRSATGGRNLKDFSETKSSKRR